jgi:hypothetical protein
MQANLNSFIAPEMVRVALVARYSGIFVARPPATPPQSTLTYLEKHFSPKVTPLEFASCPFPHPGFREAEPVGIQPRGVLQLKAQINGRGGEPPAQCLLAGARGEAAD